MSNYIIKYSDSREYMEALDTSLGKIFYSPFTKFIHVEWIEKRHEFNDTEVIMELYNRLFAYMRENLYQNFEIFFETVYADESETNIVLRLKKRYENNSSARLASRCVNFKFSIKPKFMPISVLPESTTGLNRPPPPTSHLLSEGIILPNHSTERRQQHIYGTGIGGPLVGANRINQPINTADVPERDTSADNNCNGENSSDSSANDYDGSDGHTDHEFYDDSSNADSMADEHRATVVEKKQLLDTIDSVGNDEQRAGTTETRNGSNHDRHYASVDVTDGEDNARRWPFAKSTQLLSNAAAEDGQLIGFDGNEKSINRTIDAPFPDGLPVQLFDEETVSSGMLNTFRRMDCESTASASGLVQSQRLKNQPSKQPYGAAECNAKRARSADNGNDGRANDGLAGGGSMPLNVDYAETVSSGMLKRFRRMDCESIASSVQSQVGRLNRYDANNARLLIQLCDAVLKTGEIPPHAQPILDSVEFDLVQYVELPATDHREPIAKLPLADVLIARARDRFAASATVEDAAKLFHMLKTRVAHLRYVEYTG